MEKAQIFSNIEEIVTSCGYLLIDVNVRGDNHLRIIEVYIDNEKGITTVDCFQVSRKINEQFDTQNLIESNYRLDVSSPGVDRPLKYLIQFVKHINRKFEVEFKDWDKNKKIIAKLIKVDGDQLFFSENKAEYKINFENIIKAKVLISF